MTRAPVSAKSIIFNAQFLVLIKTFAFLRQNSTFYYKILHFYSPISARNGPEAMCCRSPSTFHDFPSFGKTVCAQRCGSHNVCRHRQSLRNTPGLATNQAALGIAGVLTAIIFPSLATSKWQGCSSVGSSDEGVPEKPILCENSIPEPSSCPLADILLIWLCIVRGKMSCWRWKSENTAGRNLSEIFQKLTRLRLSCLGSYSRALGACRAAGGLSRAAAAPRSGSHAATGCWRQPSLYPSLISPGPPTWSAITSNLSEIPLVRDQPVLGINTRVLTKSLLDLRCSYDPTSRTAYQISSVLAKTTVNH